MDFDDFDDIVKYDLLFNDDELPRKRSDPPPNNGSGCLTSCIVMIVIALFVLVLS